MAWLSGHVAVITGGASGLGRALVERFLAEGARVVALDRAREKLDPLARELGPDVAVVHGDVTSLADNQRAVAEAVQRFGRLDVFVGNAGVFDHSMALADIPEDRLEAAFDEVFAVNVKGYLLGAKAALAELVRSRGSLIFTLSPAAAYAGCGGVLYTASKHAGVGIVRELAHELAPSVRVNGVAPGAIRTDLRGPRALDLAHLAVADVLPPPEVTLHSEPLGRFAEAHEHTAPYVMLASREQGATMTGLVLHADSGVGIRGVRQPAGGRDLPARYGGPRAAAGDGDITTGGAAAPPKRER